MIIYFFQKVWQSAWFARMSYLSQIYSFFNSIIAEAKSPLYFLMASSEALQKLRQSV
jgi:hypothetical protein